MAERDWGLLGMPFSSMRTRVLAGVLVAFLAVTAVVVFVTVSATGRDLPRGPLAVPTLAAKPAALDRPVVVEQANSTRKAVGLPALAGSSCLDGLARAYATAVAKADPANTASVTPAPAGCAAGAATGWAVGSDPTGAAQAKAMLTRSSTGPSPVVDKGMGHVGVAVVARHDAAGRVTGYVFAWAVAK